MASRAALIVFFAFWVVFCCLNILPEAAAAMARTAQSGGFLLLARLAATALVPAVVATLALAPLLLYAHVRELSRGGGGGAEAAAGASLVAHLATATLLVAAVALLSGAAVMTLGGADDVGWLNVE